MQNYSFNPYQQQRFNPLRIYSVSNIMEANSTPVDNFEPVFFFNRAENVIYKKQIDSTGAAPIQIFKMAMPEHENSGENTQSNINPYEENFKALNDKIDGLYKFFEEEEKGGKK